MLLKTAIVGAGEVVNKMHLPVWKKMRDVEIVGICDVNEEAARSTASRWKVPRYYAGLAELLDYEKPHLIDICTPPATHLPLVTQALEAGCHILLEKPMAMTLEESQKILEAYAQRKHQHVKLSVIHNWLFDPFILDMLSKIERGNLGDVLNAEIKICHFPSDPMISDPNHWCHALPGGRFGEVLIHPIYLLYRLLGNQLEMVSLQVAKRGQYPWVPYDDLCATFKGEKGFGNIYISFNSPRAEIPTVTIYGTKGDLRLDMYNMYLLALPARATGAFDRGIDSLSQIYHLWRSLVSNVLKVMPKRFKTGHEVFFRLFINSLQGKGNIPLTLEEAYEAHRIYLNLLSELENLEGK